MLSIYSDHIFQWHSIPFFTYQGHGGILSLLERDLLTPDQLFETGFSYTHEHLNEGKNRV